MKRVALLVAVAVLAGCGGDGASDRLTIFAASSLTEVFRELAPDARFQFAGSDKLALQIREGARPDVFAAASIRHMRRVEKRGLVENAKTFATNTLVVIVPKGNPAGIEKPEDLEKPGLKLVIGAKGVPIGDYTRKLLRKLELDVTPVSDEEDVKSVVAKVALGEADAGIVYATDVKPVAAKVEVIELPKRAQPRIEYPIATLKGASPAAKEFVDLVLGPKGRGALEAAGFGRP